MLNPNRRPALPASAPPPPPPRNRARKTALRLTALAFLLATLAVVAGGMLGAPDAGEASSHWTDYDTNNNGLIEITTLAQLNAIRWDLDGDGDVAAGNAANYLTAFPDRDTASATRMGCPSGTCTGYELMSNLDFDTDGDGDVDSDDSYSNWVPIGASTTSYSTNFNGNGHTIANLTINSTGVAGVGLFGHSVSNSTLENVGLTDVNITAAWPSGIGFLNVGAFVGQFEGTLRNSYATGTITTTAGASYNVTTAGGLIGYAGRGGVDTGFPTQIDANWTAVNITSTSSSTAGATPAGADAAGGLVGRLLSNSATPAAVTTSYATETATSARTGALVGGLVARVVGPRSTVTASYWDTTTSAIADDADNNAPEGLATAALQTPTGYTGIYSAWNIDIDGDDSADDPWEFGTGSQYPALKYGGHDSGGQGRPFDYDVDDDGLIEITNLAQLNAIRHDLDGNGDPANATYNRAFPHRDRSAAGRMGCQPTDHDSNTATPDQATCTGYELMADLDFDTDGNGSVGAGDDYPNWAPIGSNTSPYTTAFNGNGRTISNMTINTSNLGQVGLFAAANGEVIENVGLPDVSITASGSDSQLLSVGALAGYRRGAVRASYATGTISGTVGAVSVTTSAGGLVGYLGFTANTSQIDASWAAVNISVTSSSTATGPDNQDAAGGLVGPDDQHQWHSGHSNVLLGAGDGNVQPARLGRRRAGRPHTRNGSICVGSLGYRYQQPAHQRRRQRRRRPDHHAAENAHQLRRQRRRYLLWLEHRRGWRRQYRRLQWQR